MCTLRWLASGHFQFILVLMQHHVAPVGWLLWLHCYYSPDMMLRVLIMFNIIMLTNNDFDHPICGVNNIILMMVLVLFECIHHCDTWIRTWNRNNHSQLESWHLPWRIMFHAQSQGGVEVTNMVLHNNDEFYHCLRTHFRVNHCLAIGWSTHFCGSLLKTVSKVGTNCILVFNII